MRRFSVDEYQRMTRAGILTDEDDVELLEGWIVLKMPRNPPHDAIVARLINKLLGPRLPADWFCRGQSAIQTTSSQPEPDVVVVRGSEFDYLDRHSTPDDIALVIEVADSTLYRDREVKGPVYARAGIQSYWIVNWPERRVELYTDPTGPAEEPGYRNHQDVGIESTVPLVIAGRVLAAIPVGEMFPPAAPENVS
jgi:Uma2 family endonuclease